MNVFLKVMLPVAAFALASAGAVKTEAVKTSEAKKPLITGFIQNPSPSNCLQVTVDCQIAPTAQVCMSNEATPRQVWRKNAANLCVDILYKTFH